jgi:hypothetical protein
VFSKKEIRNNKIQVGIIMTEKDLTPCVCGWTPQMYANVIDDWSHHADGYVVECTNTGCTITRTYALTEDAVIKQWNYEMEVKVEY